MENVFYLISAHTYCIEGIRLNKKNRKIHITGESIGFAASDTRDFEKRSLSDPMQWSSMIAEFLDQHQWKDHSISFLLPAEDVSFRKISFPFQERKKVEQALPYELEEELMTDLSGCTYSTQVFTMPDQNSEALVLLIGKDKVKKLQQLCFKRNLLIRNVDCSAPRPFIGP
jgi:Type II secretory pathway, component PulL